MNKFLSLVIVVLFLFSCNPDHRKAFSRLSALKGTWVSTGNTRIYFCWDVTAGEIKGKSFSLLKNDTLLHNLYTVKPVNDTLYLFFVEQHAHQGKLPYMLKKDWWNRFEFEAGKEVYPHRITVDLENDTLWHFRQENIRGKKVIRFDLRYLHP